MTPPGQSVNKLLAGHAEEIQAEDTDLPITADWRMMDAWPGRKFVLGAGTDQKALQLPWNGPAPHLLMAGTTGSGKTRMGLRPVIAEGLALGWNVLILDRSGVDFELFADYPTCKIVRLEDDPERVTDYMLTVYDQLQERLRTLSAAGASTWERMPNPGPYLMVVIDEFASLSETLKLDSPGCAKSSGRLPGGWPAKDARRACCWRSRYRTRAARTWT